MIGAYVIDPVNLDESTPPNESSPFDCEDDDTGLYEMPTTALLIFFCEYRLSTTVGTWDVPATVPVVKSVGPRPRIPSTSRPLEDVAAPID